jgi:hypothetical protein
MAKYSIRNLSRMLHSRTIPRLKSIFSGENSVETCLNRVLRPSVNMKKKEAILLRNSSPAKVGDQVP